MKSKAGQQKRFMKFITVPVRALSRARDFYVRSLSDYADKMNYGNNAMAIPVTAQVTSLPRSFTVTSGRHEAEPELVRAASARSVGERAEVESFIKQQMGAGAGAGPGPGPKGMPPRSGSVAMGRIDEDREAVYFGDNNVSSTMFPRSRSHAVSSRRLPAF
ncbi:uncharacterized protein LOC125199581 [Salvia hispanica]|uniref:uncharacterized protein LOC125199581 n=1 Tax=Salvia hispanica TaxID=49212 RepID=UPI0020090813|nr:uncharacterized protein LOC125199581 [Salvia hispanica]